MVDILKLCSGNLLYPNKDLKLLVNNNLIFDEKHIIGSGGFGSVYLIDEFAVKITDYENLDMGFAFLIKETTALSMLGRIRFIGMNDKHYYVGMDYYPGQLTKNNILIVDDHALVMKELAKELLLIHSLGIIHCDIKFGNISIDKDGHFKLIDFGSCRFTSSLKSSGFIGTPVYRDYLLLDSKDEIHSFEVDIWSLGIVFYVMETGRQPFEIINDEKDQKKHIEENWNSAMTNVSELVKGMLTLTKEDRWTLDRIICVTEYIS